MEPCILEFIETLQKSGFWLVKVLQSLQEMRSCCGLARFRVVNCRILRKRS